MSFKGQISYCLRNAETLEIEGKDVVDNIVTEAFYERIPTDFRLDNFSPVITSAELGANRYLPVLPCNLAPTLSLFADTAIPLVSQAVYFPAEGETLPFIQYSGRFNVPASTRTIKTIALVKTIFTQATLNSTTGNVAPSAYAKLNTPCIQTTSQVLDIYYRIFFTMSEDGSSLLNAEFIQRMLVNTGELDLLAAHTLYPTPLVKTLKSGDENKVKAAAVAHLFGLNNYNGVGTSVVTSPAGKYRLFNWSTALADLPGQIFSALITGGDLNQAMVGNSSYLDSLNTTANRLLPVNMSNLSGFSKIQNLIGHNTTVKSNTSTPWLDVDNLPTGTGKAYLSGTWNNVAAPLSTGLYSKALLPQLNTIKVTTSGQVGVSNYKFKKRNFFGHRDIFALNKTAPNRASSATNSAYTVNAIPSMCATGSIVNGAVNHWRRQTLDAGKSIVEDITPSYFNTAQLSASCKYDDGSFILVKKNKLILYSIGAGDYWKFNGPYTEIHQVAVVQGKIYVACRDTGLYVIDPLNSLDVVSLAAPAAGIDLSQCYGVAEGYGNTVWVVGINGLMKLDGGVWTKHDSTTSPAFTLTGVSDNKWSNIEYLKVDVHSTTFQMMLIRRVNADVNPTLFGVWWSTATAAANSFADILTPALGRPRVNRTHFGGSDGLWAIANTYHKVTTFGNNALTTVIGNGAFDDANKFTDFQMSIHFVRNSVNQTRLMRNCRAYMVGTTFAVYGSLIQLVDSAGVVTDTVQSAFAYAPQVGNSEANIFGKSYSRARTSVENTYGFKDCAASFIMDKGAMITLWCGRENEYSNNYGSGFGTVDNLLTCISNYAYGPELDGGVLAYLEERNYGWDGSAWTEASTNSKPTHTATEALSDGVSVRFEEGPNGVSFNTPNYYTYGVCEGLMKDTATRHSIKTSFFFRKRLIDNPELSAYVVPASTSLTTGIVGLDTNRSSAGALIDGSNQVYFPLEGGGQYGLGDKQVTGDFEISYAIAGLSTAELNWHSVFGIGKFGLTMNIFGFTTMKGVLYTLNGAGVATTTSVAVGSVTSMKIKRVNGVITALVNDVVKATNVPATSGINLRDDRLDMFSAQGASSDQTYLLANRYCPATTITLNGSDSMVFLGNPATKTGAYGPRFNGVDTSVTNTVTLAGVSAVLKYDGTAPLAGEVTIDAQSGALYFNAADAGKAIVSKITYTQTD